MCKAVILLIEIAALVQFGLQTLVVDHRSHAVLIRQGEIKQLELDRYRLLPAVSVYRDGSGVNAGRKISIGVDLDPYGLILIAGDTEWKAATAGTRVLRNELLGLHSGRVGGRRRRTNLVNPIGVRRYLDVHVVDG